MTAPLYGNEGDERPVMDKEEERFTLGLGMTVRAAAALEYTLHNLAAHLLGERHAYGAEWASDPVGRHVKACEAKLQGPESPVPSPARDSILDDLEACRKALERRNSFVHCYWVFDDEETFLWWGMKASRENTKKGHLQIERVTSMEPQELAVELDRLNERLIAWDIEFFGEEHLPEDGEPVRVSVKRW